MLMVVLLAITGCQLPGSVPATIAQRGGLPTLRHLDWGAHYYAHALYSPDGRWIAVLAGDDFFTSHLEVVSPDGKTQYDLSSWGCGQFFFFDYVWLPDGRLSCIRANEGVFLLCIGAAPFHTCTRIPLDARLDIQADGTVWTPDGAHLLFTPNRCDDEPTNESSLCILKPDGTIIQAIPQPELIYQPQWRPHTATLSYILGSTLVLSATQWEHGQLILGQPHVVVTHLIPDASRYTWSPSGHWIAARAGVPNQDRIYLINADHPEQTITVLDAVQTQEIMSDPIWSPDGKTLIVTSPKYDQPYAINIADYLHSKGLDV